MADDKAAIATRYRRFAVEEAAGRSPLYATIALAIAGNAAMLEFLAGLPADRQQPNLLLAAVRHLQGTAAGWDDFRAKFKAGSQAIRSLMLERTTQTNEPARCAVLLPVLAQLPGPLALIEVGASAGLCLLPDRYGYRYGEAVLLPAQADGVFPTITCRASPNTPLPEKMPEIVWRAGLDLNPLDVSSEDDTRWLETLVWPEQVERAAVLSAALQVARQDKPGQDKPGQDKPGRDRPHLVRGDLCSDLQRLAAEAPAGVTRVIFHTAVLAYVPSADDRAAFCSGVGALCDVWIANESPRVFPAIAQKTATTGLPGQFLLSVNGRPTAWTDPHGASIDWIDDAAARP